MNVIFHSTTLLHKQMLSQDIMELRFERPENFVFRAGQFVQFEVPFEGATLLRPYSISSAPRESYLEFCVKIIPGGKASVLFSGLKVGEQVRIGEAKGVFICRPEHKAAKMFIATGAGLAPVMSMMGDQLTTSPHKIELLFGIRTPADIFWLDRLALLQKQYVNFTHRVTLSRPDQTWTGLCGRVTSHLHSLELTSLALKTEFYICGSVEMVKDVRGLLLKKGVNTKSIHFEIF